MPPGNGPLGGLCPSAPRTAREGSNRAHSWASLTHWLRGFPTFRDVRGRGAVHPKAPVGSRYSGQAEVPAGAGRVGGEEDGVVSALLLPASAAGLRQ